MEDLSFFLGANTYHGFYSLYEEYLKTNAGSRVWILKGGAGCGKSGFMRRVNDRVSSAGYMVHRILCSGDPSSLDGIHIPALGVILLDGTAPHILEPPLVGDRGFYLDLSRFYRPGVPDLRTWEEAYQKHYQRAYCWLAAAGKTEASLTLPEEAETIIRRKAAALIARELRAKGRNPGKTLRQIRTPGSDRLADYSCCRCSDTVARHIAQTLFFRPQLRLPSPEVTIL